MIIDARGALGVSLTACPVPCELLRIKMAACVLLVLSNIPGGSALARRYLNNLKSINPSLDTLKDVILAYFEKIKRKLSSGVLIMQLLSDLHIGKNIFKSFSNGSSI